MKQLHSIVLLIMFGFSVAVPAFSLGDRLNEVIGVGPAANDEILDPELAFLFSNELVDAYTVQLHWAIEPGYYLYQNRFAVESQADSIAIGELELPEGEEKDDPTFGKVIVNKGNTVLTVPLRRNNSDAETLQLLVKYQGCKEDSVCYPPQEKLFEISLPAVGSADRSSQSATGAEQRTVSEQDAILQKLSEGSILGNIAVFFVFGLLLSFTPCVFPMVPILSGIIVGQGKAISTYKAFLLSLSYVLAMALTYALLGILAGSFEFNLQAASQNAWVIGTFSLVFIALALSMFGFYEFQLPSVLQNRLHKLSDQQSSGSIRGSAIMGVLSAVIVGPCVAPPLAGALLYISQTGNALLGGLALFAMGLGFGVPLMIIGTSAGKLLPRAGGWMDAVKAVFGVIMLGVAIWFLERILPGTVTLVMWAALLIVSAIYMGALDPVMSDQRWPRLWKGLGLLILVYGVLLVVAATLGGKDPLRPFSAVQIHSSTAEQSQLAFKSIKSLDDLNRELQQASLQSKAVMLDFYADWCIVCKELETYTFTDPAVHSSLKDVVLLKADVTENDATDKALLKHFNLFGPPAILFFDDQASERKQFRLVGFISADNFAQHIEQAKRL